MARHWNEDERDYRDVQENARGGGLLALLGLVLMAVALVGLFSGPSESLVFTTLLVVALLAGVALLYVGTSLRRDARKATLRHQETSDPWEDERRRR
ncbi:hypothetical protein [Olsenella porci]|uniref:Uncharacterized protein n=1 Tax=Olsenella porci TaxID=2652279 RepID=A0A6N7XPY3_9ACTN|nr:hypothetical protein [Olsenella porci]MST73044.1 hypothetical protein [Olsenella porci]